MFVLLLIISLLFLFYFIGNQYSANFHFHTFSNNKNDNNYITNKVNHHHQQQHDDYIYNNYRNCKINNPNITYLILECKHFEIKLIRLIDDDEYSSESVSYSNSNDHHSNYKVQKNNYADNFNYTYGVILNRSEYSTYSMNLTNLYYTMRINNTLVRWSNITYELLEFYALGSYDIITLHHHIINKYIPLMNNSINIIPYQLFKFELNVGIITTDNEYYLKMHRKIYIINNIKQFYGYIYTYNAIIIENVLINWLHGCCDEEFSYLPNVFYNNTLVRCQKLPEVYLIKNFIKHLIPNLEIFVKHGYDFSNVHIFKRIPCELDIVKEGNQIT